ncbi:GPI transamidase component PIG-T [Lipomyces kononenkoae]|uniref:GPI transamidase component PIG-T n=1 Tax=Lipomyces kononenkoae TaxID=34357 RepID=A0ACC3T451_LIPKO
MILLLPKIHILAVCVLCHVSNCAAASSSSYSEHLDLTPLPRNNLLASFNFEVYSDPAAENGFRNDGQLFWAHYGLFPRSVGQIVQSTHTHELHLRFTQGWWDAEEWGLLPHNGKYAGGSGVEVWAWIAGESDTQAENRWYELVNGLSGLFCASLNFVDSTRTTPNPISFRPDSNMRSSFLSYPGSGENNTASSDLHLYHGSLPRETVCTENLTPFLKLLPCKGRAGISSLLDGHRIFDSKWQSMALDFVPICDPDSGCRLHMTQKVDVVLDVQRSLQRQHSPIPHPPPTEELQCDRSKPYHSESICFPLPSPEVVDWKLSDIFGLKIKSSCLVDQTCENEASSSSVCTHITPAWRLSREDGTVVSSTPSNACFSLHDSNEFDLFFSTANSTSVSQNDQPPVYIQRSMTGRGQQNGGIQTIIYNPSMTDSVSLIYLESLPWYMKPYIHTMVATLSSADSAPPASPSTSLEQEVIKRTLYRPFLERVRGTYLELKLEVPPESRLTLSYDFDKTLLYLAEYPPDANRGFDVPPGILTVLTKGADGNISYTYALRTSSLLLSLPTPDFSMPYNVIILTSTVMALAFGTVYNILVRRFVYEDDLGEHTPLLQRIKQRIRARFVKQKTPAGSNKSGKVKERTDAEDRGRDKKT